MNLRRKTINVIPAKAGIQKIFKGWIPAFAGMTMLFSANAFTVEEKLPNQAKEQQAQELFHEIKCLVCSGESLSESNADLAVDMRILIRKKLSEGQTPDEIKTFLTGNYGEQILQTPPFAPDTYLLWFAPLIIILAGIYFITRNIYAGRN